MQTQIIARHFFRVRDFTSVKAGQASRPLCERVSAGLRNPGPWKAILILPFAALALIVSSGCSLTRPREDPTHFYVLRSAENAPSGTEAPVGGKRWKIGLRPVEIPNFLKASTMAVRLGPNEIIYADFNRWAEPLDQGIARGCKVMLAQAPNVESVNLNSRGGSGIDCEITLRVLECEGLRETGGAASISFKVSWEMRIGGNQTATKRGMFEAGQTPWKEGDYGQLAELLSGAAGQLGEALAAELKGKRPERREEGGGAAGLNE
jgi:uncharacterized lipoprotein YmbA